MNDQEAESQVRIPGSQPPNKQVQNRKTHLSKNALRAMPEAVGEGCREQKIRQRKRSEA